ncbi:MAG: CpcT/CpeT family chromophore lyase [Rhodospirillaceae bacterium]|nr:CpcT/CpeT family chromophore lyase [Rhodospirillaceae bacterium]
MLKRILGAAGMAAVAMSAPAQATNSKMELAAVLRDLMAWMPGSYSSAPQVFFENEVGPPPDGVHENFHRVFAKIDAPHLGEHVMYTQIRIEGDEGTLYSGQQVLFIISIDEKHQAVNVAGRRIKDPENYVDAHLHPEMWSTIAPDPDYGGNCDFRWRRSGAQLKGVLNDGTCTMVSKRSGTQLTWDAEWILTPGELWIYDNGYLADGSLFQGRADKTHLRMYKSRDFECFASYRPAKGDPVVNNGFVMHDRGDVHTLVVKGLKQPVHLHLMRSMWPSDSGRNYADLLRLELYQGEPDPLAKDRKMIGYSWAGAASDRTGFDAGAWSARCKLK